MLRLVSLQGQMFYGADEQLLAAERIVCDLKWDDMARRCDSRTWLSLYTDKATGWTTVVQFSTGATMGFFSLRHRIQTSSGAPAASYAIGTGCYFLRR
jgi:hypothetical protein